MNGKSISMIEDKITTDYALRNTGKLTIKDSVGTGSVNSRGMYNGYDASANIISTAELTIESGNFNAKGTNGGAAVFNYGTVMIKGGSFTSVGGYSLNNQSGSSMTIEDGVVANNGIYCSFATLVVNGGEITGNRSGCHVLYAWSSTVTINDGDFYNYNSGNATIMAAGATNMTINDGTYGIKDGRIPDNGNTWTSCLTDTANSAILTINGGTFNGGIRVQGGTTTNINGGSFNDCGGSAYNIYGTVAIKGGEFTDATAKAFADKYVVAGYKVAEEEQGKWVVSIAIQSPADFQSAIENAKDGEVITLAQDIVFDTGVGSNGISCTGGASFTIDLNGHTISSNLGGNALRFKIGDGNDVVNKNVEITIKNGTVISEANNWCAISAATADNSGNKLVLNLQDLDVEASKAGDYAIKSWAGATIKAKNVNVTSSYAGCFYAVGGELELNNCTATQTGLHTSPYMSMAVAVSTKGKAVVNSGVYTTTPATKEDAYNQGSSHGSWCAGVMNSGGTLIINGGTFANGNYGDDSLATAARGLIFGDTASVVEINGGTFNALKNIIDYQNNLGVQPNPVFTISGGVFNANPTVVAVYGSVKIAEGFIAFDNGDGTYSVIKAMSFADFKSALVESEYNYDGQGSIVFLKDSERSWQNNRTCQFFIGSDSVNINSDIETMTVKNITFIFEDDDTANNYVSGELQVFAKNMVFESCVFENTSVSPWETTTAAKDCETATFKNCTFKNLDSRYGIHQNQAATLTVIDCDFINCERGIHTNSPAPVAITITGCEFTGIGDGYGMLCLAENGDYTETTINVLGNTCDGVCLRQLNTTVSLAQVTAILNGNTYNGEYVSGSIIPEA